MLAGSRPRTGCGRDQAHGLRRLGDTLTVESRPMMLIGPAAFLPALKRASKTTACSSPRPRCRARELIVQHRPATVVFERIFAMTPRGSALIREHEGRLRPTRSSTAGHGP